MQKSKLLTIITVVYNDVSIEKTINSVLPFLSEDIEYVIIDGGSSDGTKDIISQYRDYLSYYVSEPDNGIYDAMNKGVEHSNGTYLLHLNCGDTLCSIPIDLLKVHEKEVDILSFPVEIDNGVIIYHPLFDYRVKFRTSLHHQGTFYRKNLVRYNCEYNIFADFDLNQRLFKSKSTCLIFTAPIIANHLENGVSAKTEKRRIEYSRVIKNNFGLFYVFVFYLHLVYKLLRRRKNY